MPNETPSNEAMEIATQHIEAHDHQSFVLADGLARAIDDLCHKLVVAKLDEAIVKIMSADDSYTGISVAQQMGLRGGLDEAVEILEQLKKEA